ncbi:MAG: GNAT family N-acetyltransferase, partial [Candidatus Thermoplasmatota archaeon]|nr:GNAT family N-acetyltransferase [Candidatus Thermoplasmatota archaeon]
NVGLGNTFLGMLAYAPISREIVSSLGTVPDTVSASVGEGTLMSGVHQGFRQLWGEEEVEKMPRLLGGSLAGKNSIIWAYKKGMSGVEPLQSHSGKTGPRVSALVNTSGSNGQPALNAIYDTNGMGCSFSEEELAEFKRMLKNAEGIHLTIDSAAAFGPLLRAKEEGIVGEGKHVVILSTGHTNLDIRFLEKKMFEEGYASLIKTLDTWLERFSDPLEEIKEALDNAFEEGYVLGASLGGRLVGLCILSRMELDTFFPRYHLSYIAADKRYAGRGVATELMEKAIEVSDGELSLHVEPDNKRAIRLYKKMGLDVQYYRMKYGRGDADAS